MATVTANLLKELAYFYTNTDRSALEDAGLIQRGPEGDTRWKRFNHNFDVFILKLSDEEQRTLAAMANDYVGGAS
jgi:hypothetical protein